MASRKQLEAVLDELVTSSKLRSISVSGEWGTGKTYLIRGHYEQRLGIELLKQAKLAFIYVSLFGLRSIEEVRQRISVAAIGKNGKKLTSILSRVTKFAQNRVSIAGIELDLTTLGETSAHYIQEAVTRNLVVCLDDFERCNEIDSQQLLGLIAELVEQRGCKCLLVYNQSKLDDQKSRNLTASEEKAFDLALRFQPTVEENLPHGFRDQKDGPVLAPVFTNFGVNNIRIMRRIEWILEVLQRTKSDDVELIWPIIVRHAAIISIVKYAFSDELPNLSVLTQSDTLGALMGLSRYSEKLPEKLRERLKASEFRPSEIDTPIIDMLQTGYLDEKAFKEAVATVAVRVKHAEERDTFDRIWTYPQTGFIPDPAQYVRDLKNFVHNPPAAVTPVEVAFLCEHLLQMAPVAESELVVKEALSARLSRIQIAVRQKWLDGCPNVRRLGFIDSVPYAGTQERIRFAEVFKNVAEDLSSWNPSFYQHISDFSDEEIIDFLLAWRSPIAMEQFRAFLNRTTTPGSSEGNSDYKKRVEQIFQKIAKRNAFWKHQVENFVLKAPVDD